jgi:hypothetical protein
MLLMACVIIVLSCKVHCSFGRYPRPTRPREGTVQDSDRSKENGTQMDKMSQPTQFNDDSWNHINMEVDEIRCHSGLCGKLHQK